MMRVAYVCADAGVPVFGQKGSSIHVQEVIRALIRRGAQVYLFASRLGGDPPAGFETVRTYSLPPIPKGDQATREQTALANNRDLRNILETTGHFDLVYERYSLWSFAGMDYACTQGIPGLLEVNAPLLEEQAQYRELVDHNAAERVAQKVFRTAARLIAVSQEVATYLQQFSRFRSQVRIVPNGVNLARFPKITSNSSHSNSDVFTVGFVGTLKPWHGLTHLVEAFTLLHKHHFATRLLIVGDGPQRTELENDLASRGLQEAVQLTGAVAADQIPALLGAMDVAVAPYPDLPGFYFSPLKVLEYMAANLAVVASDIGQIRQMIQHKVNGLLCKPGDVEALADTLLYLYQAPGIRRQLGRAAREKVSQHYTWDGVVQQIIDIVEQIPEDNSGQREVSQ